MDNGGIMFNKDIVCITGAGHSGTRLVYDILSMHSGLDCPDRSVLSVNSEHDPTAVPITMMAYKTPLNSIDYLYNKEQFVKILEDYISICEGGNNKIILKIPFVLIVYASKIEKLFNSVKFIYCNRDIKGVLNSFVKRGEHIKTNNVNQITSYSPNMLRLVPANERKYYLERPGIEIFERYYHHCNELKQQWNNSNDNKFIDVDMAQLKSNARGHIKILLDSLGLDCDDELLNNMSSKINNKRL